MCACVLTSKLAAKQGMINVPVGTMRCVATPGIILKSELHRSQGRGLKRLPITMATSLFSNPAYCLFNLTVSISIFIYTERYKAVMKCRNAIASITCGSGY